MQNKASFIRGTVQASALRYHNNEWQPFTDTVSIEVPLIVHWQDTLTEQHGQTRLWAWPEDLAPLALGHVLLDICKGGGTLARRASVETSDNGHYRVTLHEKTAHESPLPPPRLAAQNLFQAMRGFIEAEGQWDDTGCFHRAGVYDAQKAALLLRTEDIGRHNCLDRIGGWSAMTLTPLSDKVLLTSARITASLCGKALRAGFRVMVSRSAVTTASIALAQEHGVTLVGFARTDEKRFTVFADTPKRLSPGE